MLPAGSSAGHQNCSSETILPALPSRHSPATQLEGWGREMISSQRQKNLPFSSGSEMRAVFPLFLALLIPTILLQKRICFYSLSILIGNTSSFYYFDSPSLKTVLFYTSSPTTFITRYLSALRRMTNICQLVFCSLSQIYKREGM